jgi:hypothetical protein
MAGWVAGAVAVSGYLGSQAAKKGGEEQAGATRYASDLSQRQYEQTREDQMPFTEAGKTALNQLIPLALNYKPFDYNAMTADPGYGFRLSEGQKALDRQAAARGGLISGSALKAATRYGQDMGSQEYTNAFNRYQTERVAQLNPLQSLAGMGQTTMTNLGTMGAANAANMGNYATSGAAASAAGRMGQTQAFTSGLGTYLNYRQGNNLADALRRNQPQQSLTIPTSTFDSSPTPSYLPPTYGNYT